MLSSLPLNAPSIAQARKDSIAAMRLGPRRGLVARIRGRLDYQLYQ